MDELSKDQLRTLAKMSAGALVAIADETALDRLARCCLFIVNCYAMAALNETEAAEASKRK